MKKKFNEGNQIHNFISNSGSGTVINYGSVSGSDFLTRCLLSKSYGSYGSGSTTLGQRMCVYTVQRRGGAEYFDSRKKRKDLRYFVEGAGDTYPKKN
jgi:hypothetical protein